MHTYPCTYQCKTMGKRKKVLLHPGETWKKKNLSGLLIKAWKQVQYKNDTFSFYMWQHILMCQLLVDFYGLLTLWNFFKYWMYVNLSCQTEKKYFMNVSFISFFVCFFKKGGRFICDAQKDIFYNIGYKNRCFLKNKKGYIFFVSSNGMWSNQQA